MPEQNKYLNWVARWLSGNASEEESRSAPNANTEELRSYQQVWQLTGKVSSPSPSKKLWQKIADEIREDETPSSARRLSLSKKTAPNFSKTVYWALRIAAVLFVVLLGGWLVKAKYFPTNVALTQNREHRTIVLADGSRVEMNAASRISYSTDYSKTNREITLAGEAFFTVTAGSAPFVVKTKNSDVKVLGTAFNVRSRDNTTTVAVERGKVSLANNENREVILQKGQMSRVEMGQPPTVPEAANLDGLLAWRAGRLEFQRTSLHEVLSELQRQFGVSIRFSNPNVAGLTLTASFQTDQPIKDVLTAICLTFNWEFHQSNNVYIIENRMD